MTRLQRWCRVVILAGMLLAIANTALAAPRRGAAAQQEQDASVLTIDQFHMIVSPEDDLALVAEVYLLGNSGDGIFAAEDGVTAIFPLPVGAQQVTYDGAEDGSGTSRLEEGGIVETRPVPPGVAMLESRYAYQLPFSPGTRIAHTMPLPVQSGVLLLSGVSWKLAESDLESGAYTDLGVMEFGGEFARTYMISSLAMGEMLAFTIVEEDAPMAQIPPSALGGAADTGGVAASAGLDPGMEVGLGIVAMIAAVAVSYGLWRNSSSVSYAGPPVTGVDTQELGPPPDAAIADLHAMAELDSQFARGLINPLAYRRLRERLKARVRAAVVRAMPDD